MDARRLFSRGREALRCAVNGGDKRPAPRHFGEPFSFPRKGRKPKFRASTVLDFLDDSGHGI